jgi:phosphatidylglycerophosphatase A
MTVTALSTAPRRPRWSFAFGHPLHAIALGFGSGLAPRAPGTVGTLFAWAAFLGLQPLLTSPLAWATLLATGLAVGCWACTVTARDLAIADPGCIVWDEIIAFWLVLWLVMPADWLHQCVAFALFRFFDAAKPGPVAWADALFKPKRSDVASAAHIGWAQGLGIMLDDLVAALCTLLVFALWRFLA